MSANSSILLDFGRNIYTNLVNAKPSNNPKISQKTEEEIKEVYKSIFEIFDELQLQPVNSAEIEHTANEIFRAALRSDFR